MKAGLEYLILGTQLLLGALVSFGALITLAFADEVNRGRPRPPLATALQWLLLLLSLAPVIMAVLVLVARWRAVEPLSILVLWSPLLTTLVAIPSFMATLRAMEVVTAHSREEAERSAWFMRGSHFHAWNAQELGQSEEWNNVWIPAVPAGRQSGFLSSNDLSNEELLQLLDSMTREERGG